MRLDNERPSDNIEDRRGQGGGGGFGFPRGGGVRVPMGGGRGISMSTIIMLVIAYFAIKFIFGIDLLDVLSGGGGLQPVPQQQEQGQSQIPAPEPSQPGKQADVTGDAGRDFVARVLGSTERIWTEEFQKMGRQYPAPKLVLFNGFRAIGLRHGAVGHGPVLLPEG